jgi:hypothetical protein
VLYFTHWQITVTETNERPSSVEQARWYRVFLWGVAVGLGAYLLWPLIYPLDSQGLIDTDRFLAWQLAINDAMRHGKLLHWMPYFCGGVPALANPEYGSLSPFNPIGLLVNPVFQFKLEILFHLLIMPAGFVLIAKALKLPLWTIMFGVAVWIGNGFLAFRLHHGQTTFFPLMLVPLLVGWMLSQIQEQPTSFESHRWPRLDFVIGGVLITSIIILEDGILVLLYTVLILAILAGLHGLRQKDIRPLIMLSSWIIGASLLCAARVFPMVELLVSIPRLVTDQDFLTPSMAVNSLFARDQLKLYLEFPPAGHHNIWAAYGAYCGIIPFILSTYATIRRPRFAAFYFVPILMVGLVFMFGNFASFAPWTLVRQIPPLTMVRASHRFVILVLLMLSVMSMLGAYLLHQDIYRRTGRRHIATFVILGLFVGIVFQMTTALHPLLYWGSRTYLPIPQEIDHKAPFTREHFRLDRTLNQVAHNQAINECNEPMPYQDNTELSRPSSYTLEGSARTSLSVHVNELHVAINADTPSIIIINHNHHPDWTVVDSTVELGRTDSGTMFLRVPKGRQAVVLRYEPRAFRLGLIVSSLFITGLLVALLVRVRARRI